MKIEDMIAEDYKNRTNLSHEEDEIDLREILAILLNKWHLFLLFGLLGIFGSYVYTLFQEPDYQVKATIYTPQKASGIGSGLEDMFKSQITNSKSDVFNQIEILKSFNTNIQVAKNLNWRTSIFSKDGFKWVECYKNEPFQITEKPQVPNLPGIKIYLKPISHQQFKLAVNGELPQKSNAKKIQFETKGSFGKPFKNDYFNFTLVAASDFDVTTDYYFVFNEPAQIAKSYQNNLDIDLNDKQSDIIKLQMEGKQPGRCIDYINELISCYMLNKLNFQTETQKKSLQFLDNQLVGMSDTLNLASTRFTQFRAQNQIIDMGQQGTMVMSTLRDIETDKTKNQMQLDYFRNLYGYLGSAADNKNLIVPSVVGIEDLSLNNMVLKLSELYNRKQILSFSARENNPTLIMVDKEIEQTKAHLEENLRNLIKNAENLNRSFEKQKVKINNQLTRLPQKEQDLINYQRRYELTNEIYTFLLQKRAEIDITLAGATPEVQIIDAARPETISKIGASPLTIMSLGLFLGLMLPGIFLMIAHFFSDTIQSKEDVEKYTNLAIIGSVAHSRTKSDTPIADNPRSGIAESYRGIRTNLQFMLIDSDKKVIAVQSNNPGEGKSFTSVNLATILAMNDKKIVLVGTDMRKPRIHKIFKASNDHGLSTFLSGQDHLNNIVLDTPIENVSLIPGGPIPPNPAELINRPEMETLVKNLIMRYDYVILDNAPVTLVTDGIIAGQHADLNLFVLRHGKTKKSQVNSLNQIAEKRILNNIALVINDVKGSFGYGTNLYNYSYSQYRNGYYEEDEASSNFLKTIRKRFNGFLG